MTSPVRPTRKKGMLVTVERCNCSRSETCTATWWDIGGESVIVCKDMRRAGLRALKPGEKRKVRIIIEEP